MLVNIIDKITLHHYSLHGRVLFEPYIDLLDINITIAIAIYLLSHLPRSRGLLLYTKLFFSSKINFDSDRLNLFGEFYIYHDKFIIHYDSSSNSKMNLSCFIGNKLLRHETTLFLL